MAFRDLVPVIRRFRLVRLLVAAAPLIGIFSSALAGDAPKRAVLGPDRQTVRIVGEGDEMIHEYTIGEWRDWAQANLTEALGGPLTIGEQEIPPARFDSFGAATLSPSGESAAFSATAYSMLTTAFVVGFLDLEQNELSVVSEPAFGGIEEFHWSPKTEYVAYALNTARAEGDRLRVDCVQALEPAIELEGEDLLEAAEGMGVEVTTNARRWMPRIRDLEWGEEGRLFFTTDGFGEGDLRWSVYPRSAELSLVEATI